MPNITHGMLRAMSPADGDEKHMCGECDLRIPIYKGAYPKTCPNCGAALDMSQEDEDDDSFDDEEMDQEPDNGEEDYDESVCNETMDNLVEALIIGEASLHDILEHLGLLE